MCEAQTPCTLPKTLPVHVDAAKDKKIRAHSEPREDSRQPLLAPQLGSKYGASCAEDTAPMPAPQGDGGSAAGASVRPADAVKTRAATGTAQVPPTQQNELYVAAPVSSTSASATPRAKASSPFAVFSAIPLSQPLGLTPAGQSAASKGGGSSPQSVPGDARSPFSRSAKPSPSKERKPGFFRGLLCCVTCRS